MSGMPLTSYTPIMLMEKVRGNTPLPVVVNLASHHAQIWVGTGLAQNPPTWGKHLSWQPPPPGMKWA